MTNIRPPRWCTNLQDGALGSQVANSLSPLLYRASRHDDLFVDIMLKTQIINIFSIIIIIEIITIMTNKTIITSHHSHNPPPHHLSFTSKELCQVGHSQPIVSISCHHIIIIIFVIMIIVIITLALHPKSLAK